MKVLLALLLGLLVLSCDPPIVFDRAYPDGVAPLSEIPTPYRGIFLCQSDSTRVLIGAKAIVLEQTYTFKTSVAKVKEKEDCSLLDTAIVLPSTNQCIPIRFINDTLVEGTWTESDTLFAISSENVVKAYKGNLVLSTKISKDQWGLSTLTIDEARDVTYRAINDRSEIQAVQAVTQTELIEDNPEKPKYRIKPTPIEFDNLLEDRRIFVPCDVLERINLEQTDIYVY